MKWLRNLAERYLGKYEEGPNPPDRLVDVVEAFMQVYPDATKRDWAKFAAKHAAQSYLEGYIRGYEYVERDPSGWWPNPSPEEYADVVTPGWRDSEPYRFEDVAPDPVFETAEQSEEERVMRQLELLKRG